MEIKISKPPIPLLWLDTWYILQLASALNGADEAKKAEANDIINRIIALAQRKLLICPAGDQDVEIGVSNNAKTVEKSREILARISIGMSLNFYAGAESMQIQRMMKAVLTKKKSVEFPWRDILLDDPIKVIDRNSRFIPSVHFAKTKEQAAEQISTYQSIATQWEQIRLGNRANKRTYQAVLEREFGGTANAILHVLANAAAKQFSGQTLTTEELIQAMDVAGSPLSLWGNYSQQDPNPIEMLKFYNSDAYKKIPFVNIGTRLRAERASGNEEVRPSDVMDIHHIATVLPYASYILVDGSMRDRLESKTKLIREYPCRILRREEVPRLLQDLEQA